MTGGGRGFHIGAVGPEAASDMAALHEACFEQAWSVDSFANHLAAAGGLARIAYPDAETEALGFVLARIAGDELEILTLAVSPPNRRAGIARALVNDLISAVEYSLRAIVLEVGEDNAAALSLYRGLGFRPVGHRTAYYQGAGGAEDAIVMRRSLADESSASAGRPN